MNFLLQAVPVTEWYQQGGWPLFGAIAVLVITNAVSLYQITLTSRNSYENQVRLKDIDAFSEKLTKFYNPLFYLLLENQNLYSDFGPRTFPRESGIKKDAAAKVWRDVEEGIILPNSQQILALFKESSHLIHEGDDFSHYLPLLNHIQSYKIFKANPNEIHRRFSFPSTILSHVKSKKDDLTQQLNMIKHGHSKRIEASRILPHLQSRIHRKY